MHDVSVESEAGQSTAGWRHLTLSFYAFPVGGKGLSPAHSTHHRQRKRQERLLTCLTEPCRTFLLIASESSVDK
jgi:hypothetical protein